MPNVEPTSVLPLLFPGVGGWGWWLASLSFFECAVVERSNVPNVGPTSAFAFVFSGGGWAGVVELPYHSLVVGIGERMIRLNGELTSVLLFDTGNLPLRRNV